MDLNVVVLSWNTAALTAGALLSVARGAEGLTVQAICVDNASTDDTVERVTAAARGAILVRNPANLGFATGNNRALPFLQGRYTCFLNSDCTARSGSLTHVVRWLDAHPEVGIATPRLVGPDGGLQLAARREPSPLGLLHRYTAVRYTPVGRGAARLWRTPPDPGPSGEGEVASVTGACLVIRTELFRKLRGFDEGYPFYWEDVDLCRRARDRGAGVAWVLDGPAVVHEGGAATAAGGGPPRLAFATGLLRYVRKRLRPVLGQAFAFVFVLGVFVRALVDAPLLAARAALSAVRGRGSSRRRLASARSWLRLLEHDAGPLLRLLARPR